MEACSESKKVCFVILVSNKTAPLSSVKSPHNTPMLHTFHLQQFIASKITGRSDSLFAADLERNREALRRAIGGAKMLVIGGAGTIGSSFIKALLPYRPGALYVVDYSENGLTELTRDLRSTHALYVPGEYKTWPLDFGGEVFAKMWRREGPFDVVANFAAHKHVRSEKDPYAIEAMIRNNIFNNRRLLELMAERPPAHFFCVSTDKAANPANVMGATKKLMEELVLAASAHLPCTTARFANVAFSNGSLPAGFLERLAKGQPLSAPLDVQRYFVSPAESGQLCLLACVLGRAGEIFFPRLEASQVKRFSDMAEDLLRALGYEARHCASEEEARKMAARRSATDRHWPVYFFPSSTDGEKPCEEFFTEGEKLDLERFESVGVVKPTALPHSGRLMEQLGRLEGLFAKGNVPSKAEIVALLQELVPGYRPVLTGETLDNRM